jgi:hypothetical protein
MAEIMDFDILGTAATGEGAVGGIEGNQESAGGANGGAAIVKGTVGHQGSAFGLVEIGGLEAIAFLLGG